MHQLLHICTIKYLFYAWFYVCVVILLLNKYILCLLYVQCCMYVTVLYTTLASLSQNFGHRALCLCMCCLYATKNIYFQGQNIYNSLACDIFTTEKGTPHTPPYPPYHRFSFFDFQNHGYNFYSSLFHRLLANEISIMHSPRHFNFHLFHPLLKVLYHKAAILIIWSYYWHPHIS